MSDLSPGDLDFIFLDIILSHQSRHVGLEQCKNHWSKEEFWLCEVLKKKKVIFPKTNKKMERKETPSNLGDVF